MDPNVIAKRRQVLEEYMSRIVLSLPSILRSEIFNQFLSISDRIATIRAKLSNSQAASTKSSNPNDGIAAQQQPVEPPLVPRVTPPLTRDASTKWTSENPMKSAGTKSIVSDSSATRGPQLRRQIDEERKAYKEEEFDEDVQANLIYVTIPIGLYFMCYGL